jgi:DNA-binding CsgD family transcriptional regulator
MPISLASLSCSSAIETGLDSMQGLVSYKTLNHEIVYCNAEFLRYTGFRQVKDIQGCDDSDLIWSDFASYYHQHEDDVFNGRVYTTLQPGRDADGRCFLFFNQKLPWRDKHGKLIGTVCQAIEIADVSIVKHFHEFARLMDFEGLYCVDPSPEIKISLREGDCLFFLLRGKTAKEIGRLLNISHRTVEAHVEHLKVKLGCKNKSELIAKALNEGYGASLSRLVKISGPVVLGQQDADH